MIRWAPEPGAGVIDIHEDADEPWCRLSPRRQVGGLPVPGISGMSSETVDGVLEGLKLVGPVGGRPTINFAYFSGPYRRRIVREGERCTGVMFCGRSLGQQEARVKIWTLVYDELLDRYPDILQRIDGPVTDRRPDPSSHASYERFSAAGYLVARLTGQTRRWAVGLL